MAYYEFSKRVGDMIVTAHGIEPTRHPDLTAVTFSYEGESPRLQLHGPNTIEQLRDLQYAIGAILADAERRMRQ